MNCFFYMFPVSTLIDIEYVTMLFFAFIEIDFTFQFLITNKILQKRHKITFVKQTLQPIAHSFKDKNEQMNLTFIAS